MQEVGVYPNYFDAYEVANDMREEIANGWRVCCCLEKSGCIIVVYEKDGEHE